MNELINTAGGLPELPDWLSRSVWRVNDAVCARYEGHLSAERRPAVEVALASYERACATRITRDALRKWLLPLVAAVAKPPPQGDFEIYVDALLLGVEGVPAAALNKRAIQIAIRTFEWWPAAARMIEILDAQARPLLMTRLGLRKLLAIEPPKPRSREISEEERQRVQALFASRMEGTGSEQPWRRHGGAAGGGLANGAV